MNKIAAVRKGKQLRIVARVALKNPIKRINPISTDKDTIPMKINLGLM
jgi:hypothetical protein